MSAFRLLYEWMLRFHALLFKALSYLEVTQISMICKTNKVLHLNCVKSEPENLSSFREVKLEVRLKDKNGSRGENNPVEG